MSSAFAFLAVTRVAFAAEFGSSGCPRLASSGEDRLLPAELSSRVRPQTASPARPPWFCPSVCSVHAAVLAVTTVSRDGPDSRAPAFRGRPWGAGPVLPFHQRGRRSLARPPWGDGNRRFADAPARSAPPLLGGASIRVFRLVVGSRAACAPRPWGRGPDLASSSCG